MSDKLILPEESRLLWEYAVLQRSAQLALMLFTHCPWTDNSMADYASRSFNTCLRNVSNEKFLSFYF